MPLRAWRFARAAGCLVFALGLAGCAHGKQAPNFTLQSDANRSWSLAGQDGKVVLLTFGFTHCTDTCPTTLAKLAQMTNALGARRREVEIAFVTVDPQRDSPAVLHAYLRRFRSPVLIGLTGSPARIAAVENAYHVWAQKIPGQRGENDYEEAHSAAIYLIDANGNLRGLRDDSDSEAALARAVRRLLG